MPSEEIEIIVTDNSTDERTEKAVKTFMKDAPCVWSYHRNNFPAERGNFELMVMNLNRGVSLARGRFIYIIHDDDFVVDGGIEMLVDRLKGDASKYSIIKFGTDIVTIDGKIRWVECHRKPRFLSRRDALKAVLSNSSFARFPSVLFRRDVYDRVGDWRVEAAGPLDFDMYIRAFREFGVMEYPDILGCYTIHDEAQTMNLFNERIVRLCLRLFETADPDGLLSASELRHAKALFHYQFILGGTYRLLKAFRMREARAIMDLFSMEEVRQLEIPLKWAFVRIVFTLATRFAK